MDQKTMRVMSETFGYLYLLSQRFEYMTDSVLKKDNLTTKQLLTLIAISEGFEEEHSPSISEVAELMSTSHQNIKKIALQLQKRGFVRIEQDEADRRRKLLRITKESDAFWNQRAQEHSQSLMQLFASLTSEELHHLHGIISKLIDNTDSLYKEIRES